MSSCELSLRRSGELGFPMELKPPTLRAVPGFERDQAASRPCAKRSSLRMTAEKMCESFRTTLRLRASSPISCPGIDAGKPGSPIRSVSARSASEFRAVTRVSTRSRTVQ